MRATPGHSRLAGVPDSRGSAETLSDRTATRLARATPAGVTSPVSWVLLQTGRASASIVAVPTGLPGPPFPHLKRERGTWRELQASPALRIGSLLSLLLSLHAPGCWPREQRDVEVFQMPAGKSPAGPAPAGGAPAHGAAHGAPGTRRPLPGPSVQPPGHPCRSGQPQSCSCALPAPAWPCRLGFPHWEVALPVPHFSGLSSVGPAPGCPLATENIISECSEHPAAAETRVIERSLRGPQTPRLRWGCKDLAEPLDPKLSNPVRGSPTPAPLGSPGLPWAPRVRGSLTPWVACASPPVASPSTDPPVPGPSGTEADRRRGEGTVQGDPGRGRHCRPLQAPASPTFGGPLDGAGTLSPAPPTVCGP